MYKRNAQGWSKHFDFMLIDILSLQAAFILAVLIRHNRWAYSDIIYRNLGLILGLTDIVVIMLLNTMHDVLKRTALVEIIQTLKHCLIVFAVALTYMFALQLGDKYSRIILFVTLLLHTVIGFITRQIWKYVLKKHGKLTGSGETILVVLSDKSAEKMMNRLLQNRIEKYNIAGVVTDGGTRSEVCGIPVVASLEDASSYISREWIDAVYIDCPSTDPRIEKLMDDCQTMAIPVHYHVPGMNNRGSKQFVEKVGGTTVVTLSINYATPFQLFMKRCLDILGGLIGSVFAVLIILVIGPIIKIKSPGPIIFAQTRIGQNGKKFRMYKLRSMYMDAEERKKELWKESRGAMFKLDFDPRIIGNKILPDGTKKTGIGEFIRKTSLDEFPQFFNVLLGQMSLVGTRPPTIDEWEKYELHHRARLACKPGITGMWQVSGRSEITDFEEVVQLDTYYITHWSLSLDIKILLKTIGTVFTGRGAM